MPGRRHGDVDRQKTREFNTGSKAWFAIRKWVLERDSYTCQECQRYGNHVDHNDGDSNNNPPDGSNWQTLCKVCHGVKTGIETGRVSFRPRFRLKPRIPVTVIAGPAGSGKTTWARQHARPDDLVLDLDAIKSEMTGCRIHESPDDALIPAIAERNRRLGALAYRGPYRKCWFVNMAPTYAERKHWAEQLNAEVVVLEVTEHECLMRIGRDRSRRGKPRAYWQRLVSTWWKRYVAGPPGSETVVRSG